MPKEFSSLMQTVQKFDDGSCSLNITIEAVLWRGKCIVTLGDQLQKSKKFEFDISKFSDTNDLIRWGFQEIQISRGNPLREGQEILLTPGDRVTVERKSQESPGKLFFKEWRMTYSALADGKQFGYLGSLNDYFYGLDDQIKNRVKSEKILLIDKSNVKQEKKKWFKDLIEKDFNHHFADLEIDNLLKINPELSAHNAPSSYERNLAEFAYKEGVQNAVKQANQTGFVAGVRFTILADMMQIQCLRADNTDLLEFVLPEGLYSTVKDLAKHNGAKITLFNANEPNRFIIEFASTDEQDKFIKVFEMMSFQGKRAFPTPNLYLGKPEIDKQFCLDTLSYLLALVKDLEDKGWKSIH